MGNFAPTVAVFGLNGCFVFGAGIQVVDGFSSALLQLVRGCRVKQKFRPIIVPLKRENHNRTYFMILYILPRYNVSAPYFYKSYLFLHDSRAYLYTLNDRTLRYTYVFVPYGLLRLCDSVIHLINIVKSRLSSVCFGQENNALI